MERGPRLPQPPRGAPLAAALALLALLAAGCSSVSPDRALAERTPPVPWQKWTPPADAAHASPAKEPVEIPEKYRQPGAQLSLAEAVRLVLASNPATAAAWHRMRASAAELSAKNGAFWPTVDASFFGQRQRVASQTGAVQSAMTFWGPAVTLNWMVLDFGGKLADSAEAREAFWASAFAHDQTIQDTVFQTVQLYYRYVTAKALAEAQKSSVDGARTNLEAAEARHRAGLSTIADVLQAKTSLSQAELALESYEGEAATIRGSLATALGVPPSLPVEAEPLPADLDVAALATDVDTLIAAAAKERPDLAAARASAEKAARHVASVRSGGMPSLGLTATAGHTWYDDPASQLPSSTSWVAALVLKIPLFSGGTKNAEMLKAQEEARAAAAEADSAERQVVVQVWSSYHALETARRRVETARDFLASASQNQEVAAGRYRNGVGSLIELVTAQAGLESARAQEIQARADWLVALARLAHDVGAIAPDRPLPDRVAALPAATEKVTK